MPHVLRPPRLPLTPLVCALGLTVGACGDSGSATTDADTSAGTDDSNSSGATSTADATGTTDATSSSGSGSTTTATTDDTSTASTTGTSTSTGDTTTTGELPPGCGQLPLAPGTHSGQTVEVDGDTREYDLFVPSSYDPDTPTSLVLNFHGLLGSPAQQADFSQFNETAEARGIVVAYPAGVGNSFNAGACCGQAHSDNVNDVLFARTLVDKITGEMCVDRKRVYATGMSNGGHMAHLLACRAADVFAAAASVTGVLGLAPADCAPSRPISMLDFHGTSDLIVSYNGAGPGYPPVVPMMEGWAARNGCQGASEVTFEQGDMRCETWPGCDGGVEVTLCTVDGGGHCWPGNGDCLFGHSSTELHASDAIADMFEQQTLP